MFSGRTGALRKSLADVADLVYVTAPLEMPRPVDLSATATEVTNTEEQSKCYTWWNFNEERMEYAGFDKSLTTLRKAMEEQGPFDGILGFSQGAAVAAVLCALKHEEKPENAWLKFNFAILVSGFKPRAKEMLPLFAEKISVPTLHMIGDTDTRVAPEASALLMDAFVGPEIFRHGGGHVVPTDAPAREATAQFIAKFAAAHPSSS